MVATLGAAPERPHGLRAACRAAVRRLNAERYQRRHGTRHEAFQSHLMIRCRIPGLDSS
jgi:hypothetical protein